MLLGSAVLRGRQYTFSCIFPETQKEKLDGTVFITAGARSLKTLWLACEPVM